MLADNKTKERPDHENLLHNAKWSFLNDQLAARLNRNPPQKWLREHPDSRPDRPIWYLPIEKVEYYLTKYFGVWNAHIIKYEQLSNIYTVQIRLILRNPYTGEMIEKDGVGAADIAINKNGRPLLGAASMALPLAKSEAIKNAAKSLGKLFGRDINRAGTVPPEQYQKNANRWAQSDAEHETIIRVLSKTKNIDDILEFIRKNPNSDIRYSLDKCKTVEEVLKIQESYPEIDIDFINIRIEQLTDEGNG
jgi:hypothetical protein